MSESVSTDAAAIGRKPALLVLTSTYPRWRDDHEPAFVHELSRRLSGEFAVTVLCPHAADAAERELLDGVDVVRFRYAPAALESLVNDGGIIGNLRRTRWKWLLVPGFLLAQFVATWRCIRQTRPAVIHAHWLIPQGLILASLSLLIPRLPPFLITSHGADLFALRGRIADWLRRWVIQRARGVTVVSAAMRSRLLDQGIDPRIVNVEPMGVDLQTRFTAGTEPRSSNQILFVGRLVEKKGLRHLIDAMPAIRAARPDVILTIAGFGPDEQALREHAERLGLGACVQFLGARRQDQLPALYRHAAVFVAPFVEARGGDQEGLGLVVIEAAGCHCPVVVSRVPANAALLAQAPELAAVPPGDPNALVVAVLAQLQRGSVPVPRSLQAFDWAERARSYAALLHAVAGTPARDAH